MRVDTWTLWSKGYPSLGIPGNNSTKVIELEHLAGLHAIYIAKDSDQAGEAFVKGVRKRLHEIGYKGEVHVLRGLTVSRTCQSCTCETPSDLRPGSNRGWGGGFTSEKSRRP